MRAFLNRRKLLFKVKTQLANSNSQGGYEQHNAKVNGQMYNEEAGQN
jgi:hypothetical protein